MRETDHRGGPEAFAAHGSFVATCHAPHPSRASPWMLAADRNQMREIFGRSRDRRSVFADNLRPGLVDRLKSEVVTDEMPVVGRRIAGEPTIAEIDPTIPPGRVARVEAWSRSVAEHRFFGG